MKTVTYTEVQIRQVTGLLDGLTTTGIRNAKRIAVIAQILDSGQDGDVGEKEGEG